MESYFVPWVAAHVVLAVLATVVRLAHKIGVNV